MGTLMENELPVNQHLIQRVLHQAHLCDQSGETLLGLGYSFPTSLGGAGSYPGAKRRPADLIPAGNADVVVRHGLQLLDVIHVGRHRGVEEQK